MKFKSELYKLIYVNEDLVSKDTLKIAEEFANIFDDKVCFAQIGKNHFLVMVYDGSTDVMTLKNNFKEITFDVLSMSPEFKTSVLDNGIGLVITEDSLFSVVDEGLLDDDESIPMDIALKCRSDGLMACEEFAVSLIAVPKRFPSHA